MRPLILYSSAVAAVPGNGGLAWLALQFLLGFRRLGYEVLLIDRLDPSQDADRQRRWLGEVLGPFGLGESVRLLDDSLGDLIELAKRATCLINVMGYCNHADVFAAVDRRVFLDIDPGFPQMWRELGLHDATAGHTDFVTLGRNVGRADCLIPTGGLPWITMPQPVVLEHWPVATPAGDGFTSIGAWRGPNGPIEYAGETFGLRVHEFRKFIDLPPRCPGERFEVAMDIHPNETRDLAALRTNGWHLSEPKTVAATPGQYQAFVHRSKAELMIPKEMYVKTRSGLLSDRSVYYLASGRPVLARDTDLAGLYVTGQGLLTFSTVDEAAAGVRAINADYAAHAQAARAIAEEHFDSDLVLRKLANDLQLPTP